jgi:hypothetical protein
MIGGIWIHLLGGDGIHLSTLATRLLSQVVSSSSAEMRIGVHMASSIR